MKAILMFGDIIMKVMNVDDLTPELIFPISRVLNVSYWKEPEDMLSDRTNYLKMSFKLIDRGSKYGIYYLRGFDE